MKFFSGLLTLTTAFRLLQAAEWDINAGPNGKYGAWIRFISEKKIAAEVLSGPEGNRSDALKTDLSVSGKIDRNGRIESGCREKIP